MVTCFFTSRSRMGTCACACELTRNWDSEFWCFSGNHHSAYGVKRMSTCRTCYHPWGLLCPRVPFISAEESIGSPLHQHLYAFVSQLPWFRQQVQYRTVLGQVKDQGILIAQYEKSEDRCVNYTPCVLVVWLTVAWQLVRYRYSPAREVLRG